jgi:hypothetical protein
MPGYNSPRRGTARTVPMYFCVVLCIVFFVVCIFVVVLCIAFLLFYIYILVLFCVLFFVLFYVLFVCCSMYVCFLSSCVLLVCKCVLYYCHRLSTQLQLTNMSYIKHKYRNSGQIGDRNIKVYPRTGHEGPGVGE